MSRNFSKGYGPNEYLIRNAPAGTFRVSVRYESHILLANFHLFFSIFVVIETHQQSNQLKSLQRCTIISVNTLS